MSELLIRGILYFVMLFFLRGWLLKDILLNLLILKLFHILFEFFESIY